MKKYALITLLLSVFICNYASVPRGYENIPRIKQNINLNWQWVKHGAENPSELSVKDEAWTKVSLPHNPDPVSLWLDSIQESWVQSDFMRQISWYKKEMKVDLEAHQKAFLEFEGVHSLSEVWVNGQFAGGNYISGYVPFHIDITPFVKSGQLNEIYVKADNRVNNVISPDPHRTDYIKWGGIYRDVYLVISDKLHVNFNWEAMDAGVHITTPTVKKQYGAVSVKTTVANAYAETRNCSIVTKIINADGLVLKTLVDNKEIVAGSCYTFKQSTGLENKDYCTWTPENPYLYRAVSYIYSHNTLLDFVENSFGFRKLELVDGKGLLLNGESFFMIGANRHQNYPHIGDAVPNSMHYEEVLRYKEAGFNTIRLSHYPQDDAFIEACDELGILLYEEPATWINWNEGEWMDNLEKSARIMIRNHRNHPSIAIWGAGINHRGAVPRLAYAAKEEDPFRLTASASSPWNGMRHAGPTDIFASMDYRRSDWAEQDFSLVMEHGCSADALINQHHISRYKKHKNNIGALAWVGADYNHLKPDATNAEKFTDYGICNMYRSKRPVYYWYQSELLTQPMVHIANKSVSKDGVVHVYSNADKVELYADGILVGVQLPNNNPQLQNNRHPSFYFQYHWKNEELKAVAYKGNSIVAEHQRKAPGEAYKLQLELDYPQFSLMAGGSDIKTLRAIVVDRNGAVVCDASNKVHFELSGNGAIVYNEKSYIDQMQAMDGVATVYIRGSEIEGDITVKATSKGLKSGKLSFQSIKYEDNELLLRARDVLDFPSYQIDIGGDDQLQQFDWNAWTIMNKQDLKYKHELGVEFMISSKAKIEWSRGQPTMLGDLCFMGADGVFVKGEELVLNISGLDEGTYEILTYHHARTHEKQFPYGIQFKQTKDVKYQMSSMPFMVPFYNANDIGERKPISCQQTIEIGKSGEVALYFKCDKANGYTWLNGFEIRRIK